MSADSLPLVELDKSQAEDQDLLSMGSSGLTYSVVGRCLRQTIPGLAGTAGYVENVSIAEHILVPQSGDAIVAGLTIVPTFNVNLSQCCFALPSTAFPIAWPCFVSTSRNRPLDVTLQIGWSDVPIRYVMREQVERVLGPVGQEVVGQVTDLIRNVSSQEGWPLRFIEIRYVRDIEAQSWDYVLVQLGFDCEFDAAEAYLHLLYDAIDGLVGQLKAEEQGIFWKKLFFDVEADSKWKSIEMLTQQPI